MLNTMGPRLFVLAFLFLFHTSVTANQFYNYHCGYTENEKGEMVNLWSTDLLGPHKYPQLAEFQDHGSIIYDRHVAICLLTAGNDLAGNSLSLFINFYEGENLNYAPGACSFLGASTYLPYGINIEGEGHISALYISQITGKVFLVSHRVLTESEQFKDDKCLEDLSDYL